MKVKGSCGRIAARRASSSSAERLRPRSRTSSSVIAPRVCIALGDPFAWLSPTGGSITITVRSCGSRSRMAAIFASCCSSSQTIAQASESDSTQWHSSGEFV